VVSFAQAMDVSGLEQPSMTCPNHTGKRLPVHAPWDNAVSITPAGGGATVTERSCLQYKAYSLI
jgi:hypothetical protein